MKDGMRKPLRDCFKGAKIREDIVKDNPNDVLIQRKPADHLRASCRHSGAAFSAPRTWATTPERLILPQVSRSREHLAATDNSDSLGRPILNGLDGLGAVLTLRRRPTIRSPLLRRRNRS